MFSIPAMLVWLASAFSRKWRERVFIVGGSVSILLFVYVANIALTKSYTLRNEQLGSNFSYTLCGLTIGKDWSACQDRYLPELQGAFSEKAFTDLLYAKAWENFQNAPSVLFQRVAKGANGFVHSLPSIFTKGYAATPSPYWFPERAVFIVLLATAIGTIFSMANHERSFWGLLWASTIASAAIVHFDDGRRVMIVSYPLIAMFLVVGLRTPRILQRDRFFRFSQLPVRGVNPERLTKYGSLGIACVLGVSLIMPALAHQIGRAGSGFSLPVSNGDHEHIVLGGRQLSGYLVVADGEPSGWRIPTINLRDFRAMVRMSNVEEEQGLLSPLSPPLPFGFIIAPRAEPHQKTSQSYIVPPEVLQQPNVILWRFAVEKWQLKQGNTVGRWYLVTKAEALKP